MSPIAVIAILLLLLAACMGGVVWFVLWLSKKAGDVTRKGV